MPVSTTFNAMAMAISSKLIFPSTEVTKNAVEIEFSDHFDNFQF